jgi:hypothetical protein
MLNELRYILFWYYISAVFFLALAAISLTLCIAIISNMVVLTHQITLPFFILALLATVIAYYILPCILAHRLRRVLRLRFCCCTHCGTAFERTQDGAVCTHCGRKRDRYHALQLVRRLAVFGGAPLVVPEEHEAEWRKAGRMIFDRPSRISPKSSC